MSTHKSILIAEPAETLSRELDTFATNKGLVLLKTSNLKEMLLTLQGERVDVLVLDAVLLEEDYGFISVIKGMERDLPIIICAENNTPQLESEIRKHKIFYYHIKSFGMEDLEMAISNAVNGLSY
ncbi:MAG: response regulator [Proteobacteria bacterium]|nr:response regulator [Pseudomonadota bacterium]